MNDHMMQYLAEALSRDNQRVANQPARLMAHEARVAKRAGRRRRRFR